MRLLIKTWNAVLDRRWGGYVMVACLWLLLLLPFLYFKPLPLPGIHDEFSYLLAGKTYAAGHLTNPTPPVAKALQTFHVLVQPSYMSKYLPGIGLQLAIGIILGHAIFGVWLTTLASGFAAYWMLRGVASRPWAILGCAIYFLVYGHGSYFGHSYWGGSLFLLEGLLVTGAFLRLRSRDDFSAALLLGMGAGGMLLTRPVEGGVFCAVFLSHLLVLRLWKGPLKWGSFGGRVLLPSGSLVILAGAFLAVSNHAVTGDLMRLGYVEYESQYSNAGLVSWEEGTEASQDIPPEFRELSERVEARHVESFAAALGKVVTTWQNWSQFYIPTLLLIPLGIGFWYECGKISGLGLSAAALLVLKVFHPLVLMSSHHFHYTAAWAAPILVLTVQGLRLPFAFRLGNRRWRLGGVGLLSISLAAAFSVYLVFFAFKFGNQPYRFRGFAEMREGIRLTVRDESGAAGGIVVVQYLPGHLFDQEYVYNDPDPAASSVVWTRYLDVATLNDLAVAYPDRDWWVVQAGDRMRLLHPGSLEATKQLVDPQP